MNKQTVLRDPRTLFEARKVAGSATYKQIKTVLYKKKNLSLFMHSVNEYFSLPIIISALKLHFIRWNFREAVRPKRCTELRQRSRQCRLPSAVRKRSRGTRLRSSSSSRTTTSLSPLAWRTSCSGLRTGSSESWWEMPRVTPSMGSRWTGKITVIW